MNASERPRNSSEEEDSRSSAFRRRFCKQVFPHCRTLSHQWVWRLVSASLSFWTIYASPFVFSPTLELRMLMLPWMIRINSWSVWRDTNRLGDTVAARMFGKSLEKKNRWASWGMINSVHSTCRRKSTSREESFHGHAFTKNRATVSASSGCVRTTP